MSVTVIIVNWNSGALLRRCLQCLERQTVRPTRVLVIDNASTDESLAESQKFHNVTLVRLTSNLGFAGGNNAGLSRVGTEFVALLNPDAFPERGWIEAMLNAAQAHAGVAAFGSCQLREGTAEVLDGTGDSYHISGKVWRNRIGKNQQQSDLIAKEIFSPCAAAAMYRRQALADAGGFDEDYFCYVEDVDLGFRMRLSGYTAMYVPEAVVHHVGSATTGGQHSDFSVYHGHRNLVWTFVKDMPGGLFWLLLPLHLLLNMIAVLHFASCGQGRVILRSKIDAIKGLRRMWRKRCDIQSRRTASVKDIWQALDKRLFFLRGGA